MRYSRRFAGLLASYPQPAVDDWPTTDDDPCERTMAEHRRRPDLRATENLELAGDGIIAADEDGRILLFNRAAEETFGYAAGEVLGLPVEVLLPERLRRAHREQVRVFAEDVGPARRVMGRRREVVTLAPGPGRGARRPGSAAPPRSGRSRAGRDRGRRGSSS